MSASGRFILQAGWLVYIGVAVWLTVLAHLTYLRPAAAEVDATGAYDTEVTIEVPDFHGLESTVRLYYNSGAGNGLVGVGWRLEASSYIVRSSPGRGAPK